jgi:hypothetical protein
MTMTARYTMGLALAALLAPAGLRADGPAFDAPPQDAAGVRIADASPAPDAQEAPEAMGPAQEMPDPASLQQELSLSPEQKEKLKVIHRAGREKRQLHQQKIQALITTLSDQLLAKAPDSDLQGTLDSLKAEHRAQQADQDAAMDQAQAVLSPTQAAQYVIHLRDKMKEGLKRWKARKD